MATIGSIHAEQRRRAKLHEVDGRGVINYLNHLHLDPVTPRKARRPLTRIELAALIFVTAIIGSVLVSWIAQ
jgi:hypothetical protein